MFRRQGQQLQPVLLAVNIVTASKLSAFFIFSVSSSEQQGNYCSGSLRRTSDRDIQRRGVELARLRSQQVRVVRCSPPLHAANSAGFGCSYRSVERRDKELYITGNDVQTQRVIFFNIRFAPMLKTWYTFREFRNR
jgi:hypothetical protein